MNVTTSRCCSESDAVIEALRSRQRRVLVTVLLINAVLFLVEFVSGVLVSSTALLADSLDMLGDALVYAFSLYVVARDDLWKARAASMKGWIMLGFGLFVIAQALYKVLNPEVPSAPVMEGVALLALAGNGACLALLWRHRGDDVNMRSVWLCSRNDIVANIAVLGAGVCVWLLASQVPDIIVGLAISALFLRSGVHVLHDASTVRASHRARLASTETEL